MPFGATGFAGTSATYAKYIGRVGALAVALGFGAAMATGQGLGLPVARAEDPPPADTSEGRTGPTGDVDIAPTPASTDPVTPDPAGDVRSALTRIANVPKMIFNATGGAHTSGDDNKSPRLPGLQTVIEDLKASVESDLPEAPVPTQNPVAQDNSAFAGPTFTTPPPAAEGGADAISAVTSIPTKVIDRVKSAVTPTGLGQRVQNQLNTALHAGDTDTTVGQQFFMSSAGQDDVIKTAQTTLAEEQGPVFALASLPGSFLSVAGGLVATALAPFLTPGPSGPAEPPLLLAY